MKKYSFAKQCSSSETVVVATKWLPSNVQEQRLRSHSVFGTDNRIFFIGVSLEMSRWKLTGSKTFRWHAAHLSITVHLSFLKHAPHGSRTFVRQCGSLELYDVTGN